MLNFKIIFIINTIIFFFFFIYMIICYIKMPNNRAIKFITYFTFFYFIGLVLLILRNNIPDFLSIVVANSLFATGTISFYFAVKAMFNLDSQVYRRYLIPVLAIFVGFSIFTYIDNDIKIRVIIFSLFNMFFAAILAWLFWFNFSVKFKLFDRVSLLLFVSQIIILFIVVSHCFFINIDMYYFSNKDFYMMMPNIFMIVLNFWMVILVKYRIAKN